MPVYCFEFSDISIAVLNRNPGARFSSPVRATDIELKGQFPSPVIKAGVPTSGQFDLKSICSA